MSKINQSPKLPAAERRQQLLHSAHQLFMKKGYRDTTTDEIARNAGLTKGALYFHFKTKEDILFDLIRNITSIRRETLLAARGTNMHPAEVLRLLLDWRDEDSFAGSTTFLDFWVQAMSIPRVRTFMNKRYEEAAVLIGESIDPAWAPNPKGRRMLGTLIISICDGLCVRMVLAKKHFNLSEEIDLLAEHITAKKVATAKPKAARRRKSK